MTNDNFKFWLDGYLQDKTTLNEDQIKLIKEKMTAATTPINSGGSSGSLTWPGAIAVRNSGTLPVDLGNWNSTI